MDYSITKRPHTPTPGVYMGRPTRSDRDRRSRDRYDRHERDRYDDRDPYYMDHYRSGGSMGGMCMYGHLCLCM